MKKIWQKKKSGIHGIGLFAKKDIPKKIKIIEYIGDKITKEEGDRRADIQISNARKNKTNGMVYVFELNSKYDIDGNVKNNHARLINHSCNPNCEVEVINNKIWILSISEIKKEEELSYNYGYSYDDDYMYHKCKCKSKNCVGFILKREHWYKLKKKR